MLIFPVPQSRHRPRARLPRKAPPILLLASFDAGGPWVRLRFDRAIDVAALAGNRIVVDDAPSGTRFEGTASATPLDPATVQIDMSDVGPAPSPDTRLNVTPANGIVAVDDGQPWAGVTNLLLPFP